MTDDPSTLTTADTEELTDTSVVAEPEAFVPAETPEARLIVKRSGAETEEVFSIHPPATIGRFDPNVGPIDVDLGKIPEGAYVSRKHAKITYEDGVWMIHDLGSSNGTFVLTSDFERVEMAELTDGAEFALGNARFVFRLS
jgi:pSer/pThr/pTyr-binding forkhead associated (FHA) protein